jgi:hypothetical protein
MRTAIYMSNHVFVLHALASTAAAVLIIGTAAPQSPHRQLLSVQGASQLEVEERKSRAEGYGKGKKTSMSFAECLRRLADGDTTLYLTTQKARRTACLCCCRSIQAVSRRSPGSQRESTVAAKCSR